jgi:alkylated DNA repair dioxygenase AlkB
MSQVEIQPDSRLFFDFLPEDIASGFFGQLRSEVEWHTMRHKGSDVPRLVALQVEFDDDGAEPIYRHPVDEEPQVSAWTPTVNLIRESIQARLGLRLNHCLIQLYRSGQDFIGEHADKTLDILKQTPIINYSLGATRYKAQHSIPFFLPILLKKKKILRSNFFSS